MLFYFSIPRIIKNNKFVTIKLFSDRVKDSVENVMLTNISLYIGMYGIRGLLGKVEDRLELFNNVDSIEDPFRREIVYRQKRAFLAKMNLCSVEKGVPYLHVISSSLYRALRGEEDF